MKPIKLTLLAFAFAFSAPAVQATTTIRITGSTAYRKAVHSAIRNILNTGFTYAYSGTDFATADQAIFTGTTKTTSVSVIVKVSWSSSSAGIKALDDNDTIATWLVNGTTQSTGGTANAPASYDTATTPDIAMGDTFQASTPFTTNTLVDKKVGVLVYSWVRGYGSRREFTNVTSKMLGPMLKDPGYLRLSQITGDSLLAYHTYVATGMNEASGIRIASLLEGGVTGNLLHTQPSPSTGVITAFPFWPPATVLGTSYPEGNSGYASTADLVATMNSTVGNSGSYSLVTCLDIDSALSVDPGSVATATATVSGGQVTGITVTGGGGNFTSLPVITITGGGGTGAAGYPTVNSSGTLTGIAVTLTGSGYSSAPTVTISGGGLISWNGCPWSNVSVISGSYSLWSYEHLYYRSGYAASAVADQLAGQIENTDYSAVRGAIRLLNMTMSRTSDGGLMAY